MTTFEALFIAVLQGVTELFPVSSLGHAVVLPPLLGLGVDERAPDFLPFLVVLHLGTAAALLVYFWQDWLGLLVAVLGLGSPERRPTQLKLLALIVVATIPAAVLGFTLNHFFRQLFGSPVVAAAFLMVNGVLLWVGERLRRAAAGERRIEDMGWFDALFVGLAQSTALIPGISRSGATMVAGLRLGLHHEAAARFSFLLATPIIAGAGVLEAPKLLRQGATLGSLAVIAGIVAGITAYLSIAFLMRYFHRHDFEALDPFAYYCFAFGALALGLLLFVF
ncbi:MAG: undecaprenyl-diphosphate phosphatase [Proteobacteria bacterium]|nr:undecaprenyl-diphosphate phosphatase [Pseudomonadota bacterium]MBI3498034.1 undecaprenyl-diphosphate phosphatase [Pseudomonadota bacterium]